MGEEEGKISDANAARKASVKRLIFAASFILLLIVGLFFIQLYLSNPLKGITVHADIPYVVQGEPSQKLDLYLPAAGKKPLPVVIFIHGGGWLSGDKKDTPSGLFARHGFASASLNYRLSSEAAFPAQATDCFSALLWLKAHAAEYNLDTSRIGVWGGSAGGHLAALLALSKPEAIKAACDWCGPTDFATIADQANGQTKLPWSGPDSPLERLLGGPVEQNKALAYAASPINIVSPDAPPFLIMHGDQDDMVPLQQSTELADALRKAGTSVDFVIVPGGGHDLFSPGAFKKVQDFFDKHL